MQLRENELVAIDRWEMFEEAPADVISQQDLARWREFRTAYDRARIPTEFLPFPLQIDFGLNTTCQMKCAFCLHGHQLIKQELLPFLDFARVMAEGKERGLCAVKLNFINEPLLRPDLPKFIECAKANGVLNVYFATNGLLLKGDMAQQLIAARTSKVMISLDAATAETFKAIRRSDKFNDIVRNVQEFISLRDSLGVKWPAVRVNFLKTPLNEHELDEFVNRWTGVADAVAVQERMGIPNLKDEQSEQVHYRCAIPFKLMAVDSNGSIMPCCAFSARELPSLGNVRNTTIAEAWNSRQMVLLKLLHRDGNVAENPVCYHCLRK
jgi:radical SAM protein with 4Fe4S-binding SPASM domain